MKEFPRANHKGTPEGEELYLTVKPMLRLDTDSKSFNNHYGFIPSLISLTISPYTPRGVNCEIYHLLKNNMIQFNFNIPLLIMIYCIRIRTRQGIYYQI